MTRVQGLTDALARVTLAVWIGAVAGVAFVAAPLIFAAVPDLIVDKDTAARVVGPAFARVDILGLVACALCVLTLLASPGGPGRRWRLWLLGALALLAALNAFWFAPAITARTEPVQTWHRCAVFDWMAILLGGSFLIIRGLRVRDPH